MIKAQKSILASLVIFLSLVLFSLMFYAQKYYDFKYKIHFILHVIFIAGFVLSKVVKQGMTCELCTLTMSALENTLKGNETVAEVKQALEQVCSTLPLLESEVINLAA